LFFTDCRIHLFSCLAARLFNKLTRSAPSAPRFTRLRRSAFPFLFIYDSNTAARATRPSTYYYCLLRRSSRV